MKKVLLILLLSSPGWATYSGFTYQRVLTINHADNEPAVTSNDNWPGALQDQPKHWDGTPDVVLSSAAPSIQDGMAEVKKQNRESLEQTLSTIGAAVFKKSSLPSAQ